MSIYILLHRMLTRSDQKHVITTRDWNHKSLSDQHATKLSDFLWWKGCCGSPGFFWSVSFGCLLWGVNFLHEKRQSLSRQYFITIWWFPEVLPPNHRLVFKAKSNVFLSWSIWYPKHQLHGKSLACLRNGSQSSHGNGRQIFVSWYTIAIENYQGCNQSMCKL